MADLDTDVARLLDTYRSAARAKDVAAFMRLYDPRVRVFDTWGVWCHDGADAWQQAIEGWFTSLGTGRVEVSFDDVVVTGTPAMASVTAIVTYRGVSTEGEPKGEMQNRLTWVLRTSGHVLRVIHEHTSAPAGFDDAKLILKRPAR